MELRQISSSSKNRCYASPALIEPCVLAGSRPGDIVLDPFGGSGTTAGVALKHGRQAILCELSEEYAKLVPERIRSITDALDQPRLFDDPKVEPEQALLADWSVDTDAR